MQPRLQLPASSQQQPPALALLCKVIDGLQPHYVVDVSINGRAGLAGQRRSLGWTRQKEANEASGFQGTDPRDKLPGNRRPAQDLNTSGNAAEPYGNELLASRSERCDHQHEGGRRPSPPAPISSLAQQNAVSFTFPTSLGLSPASKARLTRRNRQVTNLPHSSIS